MADMVVRLYTLPALEEALAPLAARGIAVRRPLAPEAPRLVAWVDRHFPPWLPEVEVALVRLPASCFVAVDEAGILGFAAYDATCRNYFGPTGVAPAHRGSGIGRALLLTTLHAQREQGYAYAIIGGVGPANYYAKVVGAQLIEGSTPGIYSGMVHSSQEDS